MSRGKKKPAVVGGSLLRDVAGQGKHTELHLVTQFCITNERNASHAVKLAVVDALLYVAERTPPGFRSLRREEITPISTPWPEYIVDIARMNHVDAVVANHGAFMIDEGVRVCHVDDLGLRCEEGWSFIRLPSVDGRVRPENARSPCILVSPDERCFMWMPQGHCSSDPQRINFNELCDLLGDMGMRLSRFEVAR